MRRLALLPALLLLCLVCTPALAQQPPATSPRIEVFEVDGVLDASQLGALERALDAAARRGVDVVLLQVDSFGGLGVSPARVLGAVRDARVPVAVWVGPRAARASGSAALLVAGADVVAASRQAVIGPALPAELGRGRDAAAEAAVFAASGLPGAVAGGRLDGAAAQAAGLVDYQAESLPDAVQRLDGRQADGHTLAIGDSWRLTFLSRSLLDRVRHGLANPTLAYLLLLGAACCLAFEWFQPGFGVAGIAGAVLALLAVYALVVLPTSWLALGALVAGLLVFTLDTAVGGLGFGTLAATALTAAGSWWLFSSPSPLLRVDGRLVVLGVLWCVVYWVVVLTVSLRAQRRAQGTEALVGSRGIVRSTLNPGGIVLIEGAMWRARLTPDGQLATGQRVHVEGVTDGVLQVAADDPGAVKPAKGRRRRSDPAPGSAKADAGGNGAAVDGAEADAAAEPGPDGDPDGEVSVDLADERPAGEPARTD